MRYLILNASTFAQGSCHATNITFNYKSMTYMAGTTGIRPHLSISRVNARIASVSPRLQCGNSHSQSIAHSLENVCHAGVDSALVAALRTTRICDVSEIDLDAQIGSPSQP